jgi:hypothetical protein
MSRRRDRIKGKTNFLTHIEEIGRSLDEKIYHGGHRQSYVNPVHTNEGAAKGSPYSVGKLALRLLTIIAFAVFVGIFIYMSYMNNTSNTWSSNKTTPTINITGSTSNYTQVILNNKGNVERVNSKGPKVRDVLKEKNITTTFDENVYPSPDQPITKDLIISVGYPETSSSQLETPLNYGTQEIGDMNLKKGTRQVEQQGENGVQMATILIGKIGTVVVSQTEFSYSVVKPPVTEIVRVGTMPDIPVIGSISDIQQAARELLPSYGWSDDQMGCLISLWDRESGWDPTAENSSSGAYGIPQALPGSKMASTGLDWQSNPVTQIRWGLGYIASRYGSPCGAWNQSEASGWY